MVASFFSTQQPGYGFSSPSALFAAGEQGVWYDPSDLSTMFQDFVGATPVTSPGQTVGLILDKSQGLARGPEKRADGSPTVAGTGSSTYDTVTGVGSITRVDTSNFGNVVFSGIEANVFYEIDVEYTSGTATGISLRSNNGVDFLLTLTVGQRLTVRLRTTTADLRVSVNSNASTADFRIYSVKKLFGNHATQATAASRPVYQVDGNGKSYLGFDGIDDFLATNTINPVGSQGQMFLGVRRLLDATEVITEYSPIWTTNTGSLAVLTISGGTYGFRLGPPASLTTNTPNIFYPVRLSVLSLLSDFNSGDLAGRVDGRNRAITSAGPLVGSFLPYQLFIGRRAGVNFPFNGRIHGFIMRFGSNLSPYQIRAAENYMNQKTGAW